MKYPAPYGIKKFYVGGCGNQSFVMDWHGNRASKDMPYSFACKVAHLRNKKAGC